MHDEEALALNTFVQNVATNFDAAELKPDVITRELIVIAGHVNDVGTLARFAQDFLQHVVVGLQPVPTFFQAPSVDNVTDQIKLV